MRGKVYACSHVGKEKGGQHSKDLRPLSDGRARMAILGGKGTLTER